MLFLLFLISNSSSISLLNCYLSCSKISCWNRCQNHFCMINATDLTNTSSGKKQLEYVSNGKDGNMLSFWDKHFNCKVNSVFKLLCNWPIHFYLKKSINACGNKYCVQKGWTKGFICNQTEIACLVKQKYLLRSLPCLQFVKRMLVYLANMLLFTGVELVVVWSLMGTT